MWKELLVGVSFLLQYVNLQHPVIVIPANGYYPPPQPIFEEQVPVQLQPAQPDVQSKGQTFQFGSCRIVIDQLCPDPEINFYLYTRTHPEEPEPVRIGSDPHVSNLSFTSFDPSRPTKFIIHGYNSDIHLSALVEIRRQYLIHDDINVFFMDWSKWAAGPCYPAAVWNAKHAGKCGAQLVERIREFGNEDVHIVGFSLGAHVTNFVANAIRPYKVPRITGLDPAGPGFITASPSNKLDKDDAQFVDIIHTNAFLQGTFEECGHVDFFLNGGVIQPGCWVENRFFACNHHRAPIYFAETINTQTGFWGWPCPSYGEYIFGRCPPREPQIIMGEHIDKQSRGVYLVITNSVSPYADGKFTGPNIEIFLKSERARINAIASFKKEMTQFVDEDDLIDSLSRDNGVFNYISPALDVI